MRRLGPLPGLIGAAAVALAAAAVPALAPGSPLAATCAGAGASHAALVVEHGDGSVVTRCFAFDTAAVTGQRLLDSSGVAWSGQTFGGFGEAVCAVDAEPEHYSTCPGSDNYWAVFVSRGGGAWQLTSVGISSLTLSDGDAEGLRYVPAVGTPAPPPVPAGVCSDAAAPSGPGTAGATPRGAGSTTGAAASSAGSGSSVDIGLLAAAVVAIGLGGLALLRLVLRRSTPARRPSR